MKSSKQFTYIGTKSPRFGRVFRLAREKIASTLLSISLLIALVVILPL